MIQVQEHISNLYRVKAEQGRGGYLRLDMNENPEGLPLEFFSTVMSSITPEMLAMYPETGELITVLAKYLGVKEENITITNGSDEGIKAIFEVYQNQAKKVITVYPTFEMYAVYAKMYNMKHVVVEYDNNLRISAKQVIDQIDEETCIVSILNPNNPIGSVFSEEEVEGIIQEALKYDAMVIIDEAYHYFYNKTFLNMINKYDNVIILRTFSKLCSLAGCRIGYAVSSNRIIELIDKVRPTYSVNWVAIQFAIKLLRSPQTIEYLINREKEGKAYIINELIKNRYIYHSEHGNFIFIKCRSDIGQLTKELRSRGILVKKYSHPVLKDFIRISTGSRTIMEKFWSTFYELECGLSFYKNS